MRSHQGRGRAAATKSLPDGMANGMEGQYYPATDTVAVSLPIPMIVAGAVELPSRISAQHTVVREP